MFCRSFRRGRIYVAVILLGTGVLMFHSFYSVSNIDDVRKLDSRQLMEGRRLFGSTGDRDAILDFKSLPPDDPRVINRIKSLIHPPSPQDYNLTSPHLEDFSRGQSKVIDEILEKKENGFFIDCGASDGEKHSVSLFFERHRHWKGLLIEPDLDRYQQLLHKHRKAHSIRACAKVYEEGEFNTTERSKDVPCFWMESFIKAADMTTIDLLNVDLQDNELQFLKSIPLVKTDIQIITVEFRNQYRDHFSVMQYLMENGYTAHHQFVNHIQKKTDLVFKKSH